ncbi:MAG TPA: LacI family transcriptional regulator, partial [Firmicutes bacterium]|nr:LacI family transcriptional regulator [Bacillota bacterium]
FKEATGNQHILETSKAVPVVLINSYLEGENIYSVLCDDAYGVREAVNYLVKQGRRDIYYFTDTKSASGLAKLEGFVSGMSEHGLDPSNVIQVARGLEGGAEGVAQLWANKRPLSAVICGEDMTAVGAMKALTEFGRRIPNEVAVIGYNNSVLAQAVTPALTSIDSMPSSMARQAVDLLAELFQGKEVSKKIVLTPRLVRRESS